MPKASFAPALRAAVVTCVLLLLVRAWLVEPRQVVSGSMAPGLLGPHAAARCELCDHELMYGVDGSAPDRLYCSRCGHVQLAPEKNSVLAGDCLMLFPAAFDLRRPRRWEVVAFRAPEHAARVNVKRVAGLPGEVVQIRDGDVWIDGRIARKSLAEQEAVAVVVDSCSWPETSVPALARWTSSPGSGWRHVEDGYQQADDTQHEDWLEFRSRRIRPGTSTEFEEWPVTDVCEYNQGRSLGTLYPVRDLALDCKLRLVGDGRLQIIADDGAQAFEIELDCQEQTARLSAQGTTLDSTRFDAGEAASGGRLWVSLFDHQVVVGWRGRPLLVHTYERSASSGPSGATPFRVAAKQLRARLAGLRVLRDVYYTPPEAPALVSRAAGPQKLGDNEFFLLGDNSPRSRDSRYPTGGSGIAGNLILGRPLAVYYSPRIWRVGGLTFQVPDIFKIRYIR